MRTNNRMLLRKGLLLLLVAYCTVIVVVVVDASNLHAPPPKHFQPSSSIMRGGAAAVMEPTGQKLRKYAETDRMPSLFAEDEETYDRYAACLAATEGLRRLRDRDMAEEIQSAKDAEDAAKKRKQVATQYVRNSGQVLRALGMSVHQFNELGKQVAQDPKLKEKIIEQAYLYRMAAAIHLDRSPLPEKLPGGGPSGSGSSSSGDYLSSFQRDKVQLFCESMNEIERLRTGQVERLKKALQVDDFPSNINISDPTLLPFLNPRVRAYVEAFPMQAEAIVKKHGLDAEEFNQMLHASKSNPIFRWKVQKHLKLEEPSAAASAKGEGEPSSSSAAPSTNSMQPLGLQQQQQQQQRSAERPVPPVQQQQQQQRPRPAAPPQY